VDVFAYGVMMVEMWMGEHPFAGVNPLAVGRMVEKGDRPKIDGRKVPADIAGLAKVCWHQSPGSRPEMSTVVHEIEGEEQARAQGMYDVVCCPGFFLSLSPFSALLLLACGCMRCSQCACTFTLTPLSHLALRGREGGGVGGAQCERAPLCVERARVQSQTLPPLLPNVRIRTLLTLAPLPPPLCAAAAKVAAIQKAQADARRAAEAEAAQRARREEPARAQCMHAALFYPSLHRVVAARLLLLASCASL
jgi:hypothetical protein